MTPSFHTATPVRAPNANNVAISRAFFMRGLRFVRFIERQQGHNLTANVEVMGAARLYRAASVLTERLGTYGQPASTGCPLKHDLSIANGIDEYVDVCIAGFATLVVLEVLQCLFFIT